MAGQTRALAESAPAVAAGLLETTAVPTVPRGRPAVVMLMGLPGAGKTHVARLLAARIAAAHVASDAIRKRMFIAPSYTPQESAMVFRLVEELVGSLLAAGHRVIVDATNLRRTYRASVEELARERAVPLAHVLIEADEEDILGRLAARRRGRAEHDHSDADERVYAKLRHQGFEPPEAGYLVMKNGPDVDKEVDRIASEIEGKWLMR